MYKIDRKNWTKVDERNRTTDGIHTEELWRDLDGQYYLYGEGSEDSVYAKVTDDGLRYAGCDVYKITPEQATKWLHVGLTSYDYDDADVDVEID